MKPKLKYDVKTGLWECCEGKLCNLGKGSTPLDAYTMWDIHYTFNHGQREYAGIMSEALLDGSTK